MRNWASTGKEALSKTGEGFYVSFRAKAYSDPTLMLIATIALGKPVESGEATALIRDREGYVLKGDHREAYDTLIEQGWEACFAYYQANISQRHPMSPDAIAEMEKNHKPAMVTIN